MQSAIFAIATIGAAFLTALATLIAFSLFSRRSAEITRRALDAERDSVSFLFDDEDLVDATPAARQLLESAPRNGSVWAHFSEVMGPIFPKLSESLKDLAHVGKITLKSTDGATELRAEWRDGLARLSLATRSADEPLAGVDQQSFNAMGQELDSLRAIAEHAPFAQWRETAAGVITWCNAAYLSLADATSPEDSMTSWPPAPVFAAENLADESSDSGAKPGQRRVALTPPGDDRRHWFEIAESLLPGGDRFFTAIPADQLVKAETSLHEFVTTITKTFASLPIGLAVFDRSRELALFNPALMDLTSLPADFLISKPSLYAVFDKLREARMIPEPKDYKNWRQQMSDLVAAAENGTYEESWALPTGQTYRVTGRPHPDGAVALMFEDISAEISLTRRFRAELEIGQATLDALPQAVAVFTAGGVLATSNDAYGTLWGNDPSTSMADIAIADAVRHWRAACAPTPVWDELRAFVFQSGPRQSWNAHVALHDGRRLQCDFRPLAHGATMVSFQVPAPEQNAADKGGAGVGQRVAEVEASL